MAFALGLVAVVADHGCNLSGRFDERRVRVNLQLSCRMEFHVGPLTGPSIHPGASLRSHFLPSDFVRGIMVRGYNPSEQWHSTQVTVWERTRSSLVLVQAAWVRSIVLGTRA